MSIAVAGTAIPAPEHRTDVIRAYEAAIPRVHEEPGCELHALHVGRDRVVVIEKWASRAAHEEHTKGPAFTDLHTSLQAKPTQPFDIQVLAPIRQGRRSRARSEQFGIAMHQHAQPGADTIASRVTRARSPWCPASAGLVDPGPGVPRLIPSVGEPSAAATLMRVGKIVTPRFTLASGTDSRWPVAQLGAAVDVASTARDKACQREHQVLCRSREAIEMRADLAECELRSGQITMTAALSAPNFRRYISRRALSALGAGRAAAITATPIN